MEKIVYKIMDISDALLKIPVVGWILAFAWESIFYYLIPLAVGFGIAMIFV
jgi:hypothetical protein